MYPFRLLMAIPVDTKGATDEYTINRLCECVKSTGVKQLVYLSDQEASLRTTFEEAIKRLAADGELSQAVPEKSAVSGRQSNGLAERSVQTVEDLMRCYKLAFDDHLGQTTAAKSPLFRRLVEHAAAVHKRTATGPDGMTPYQEIHGRPSSTRAIVFGEKVLFYIPKRKRAKLDKRYDEGVYLGSSTQQQRTLCGTTRWCCNESAYFGSCAHRAPMGFFSFVKGHWDTRQAKPSVPG